MNRPLATAEEWQQVVDTVEYLCACGLGPAKVLREAMEQRLWKQHLQRWLMRKFPDLSEQEREDCVARHLQRWRMW